MIKVTFKGKDITADVSISRCIHEMWAAGRSDTLDICFNDTAALWDSWGPQIGDEIRVDYGAASTGTMFVCSAKPENGVFRIRAMSAPPAAMEINNKAWSTAKFLQIAQEIAARHGLGFKSYNVTDRLYTYLQQSNTSDFAFLHRRAVLEGCAFLVYDKTLILYDVAAMETTAPIETFAIAADSEYRYSDNRARLYGSCVVAGGAYTGEFNANNGVVRVLRVDDVGNIGSNDEATRFAKGLLRDANCGGTSGYVRTVGVMPGYAAASTVNLANDRAPSWNGAVFLDHVRHDYAKGESKIFFRKPLEGY